MIQDVLQSIEGVTLYPAVALILFLVAFVLMVVRVWRMKQTDLEVMSRLPLDGTEPVEGDRTDG